MATEDGRIILNPYSKLSPQEFQSVKMNEYYRLMMRNKQFAPPTVTPDQQNKFSGYGSPEDIKATVMARILSGDPSSGEASFEQKSFADWLKKQ